MPPKCANLGAGDAEARQDFQNNRDPANTEIADRTQRKSWRHFIPIHPAADLFPLMSPDEFKTTADDIRQNGLRIPVAVFKAQKHSRPELLDGRNRLDAVEAEVLAQPNIVDVGGSLFTGMYGQ